MGSPEDEAGRSSDEPLHEVTISEPFWILNTEVTQGLWRGVMKKLPHTYSSASYPVKPSWNEAREFIDVLNRGDFAPEGLVFDLPTEAQWEYACRAGTTGPLAGGEKIAEVAWYRDNSGKVIRSVTTKKPNNWKLYNTLGNVAEWCADWYGPLSSESVTDPTGPPRGSTRVLRGGSFMAGADRCRCAARWYASPENKGLDIGFRLILRRGDKPAQPAERPEPIPITIDGIVYNFLGCPAGSFPMGSPLDYQEHQADEVPHEVTLSEEFWLQETEVTCQLWDAVTKEHHNENPGWESLPIEEISWEEALLFVDKLNTEKTAPAGFRFALPTEAQWEYACRCASRQPLDKRKKIAEQCWYNDNSGGVTHPIKQKSPNDWGFYDMQGNVSEWCYDRYQPYSDGAAVDPAGPSIGTLRVRRGGTVRDTMTDCRAERRAGTLPVKKLRGVGLRLALVKDTHDTNDTDSSQKDSDSDQKAAVEPPEPKTISIAGSPFRFLGCPAGSFLMGSPDDEPGHTAGEARKEVTIEQEFWMLECEVTQDLWYLVMTTKPSFYQMIESTVIPNRYYPNRPSYPVEYVSWNNCQEFIDELNAGPYVPAGYYFALPTEAQWEYACRAGENRPFAEEPDLLGWYRDNSQGKPHPVMEKKPNAWGFYDMQGNVSEWCLDSFGASDDQTEDRTKQSESAKALSAKVFRGGSWSDNMLDCRSAARGHLEPTGRSDTIGFRLVLNRVPTEPKEEKK